MVRHLLLCLLIMLGLAGCASTQADIPALRPTEDTSTAVAKITYPTGAVDYVARAEFEQARDRLLEGAPEEYVLNYVTSRRLLLREARAKDVAAEPAEVDEFVERIRTQTCTAAPIPEAQEQTDQTALLEACANFFGFDGAAGMRRYLQEEIVINQLIEQEAVGGEEIHAAHILVNTEEEAQAALERVTTGGEDFSTVARELSIEPAAQESGGDLGFFGPGQMVPEFEQAAGALEDGEISQPVQTQFGWHVIKTIERRAAEAVSQESANAYREQVLKTAQDAGQVEFLITPAPPPALEEPAVVLPTANVEPEATAEPAIEGLDTTPTPEADAEGTATP